MHRRDFLKISGVTTLLLSFPAWKLAEYILLPVEAEFKGRFFRGTHDGDIYVSSDQKQTWEKQAGFSSQYSIRKMFTDDNGQLNAEMEFQNMHFNLVLSEDQTVWRVV
jgi:hypothetical protein